MGYIYVPLSIDNCEIAIGTSLWGQIRNTQLAAVISHINSIGEQLQLTDGEIDEAGISILSHINSLENAHNCFAISVPVGDFGNAENVHETLIAIRNVLYWTVDIPAMEEHNIDLHNPLVGGLNAVSVRMSIFDEIGQYMIGLGAIVKCRLKYYDINENWISTKNIDITDFINYSGTLQSTIYDIYGTRERYVQVRVQYIFGGRGGISYETEIRGLVPFALSIEDDLNLELIAERLAKKMQIVQETQEIEIGGETYEFVKSSKIGLR